MEKVFYTRIQTIFLGAEEMNPKTLIQIVNLFVENQEINNISLSNVEVSETEFTQIKEKLSIFSKYQYDGFDCVVEEYTSLNGGWRAKIIIAYNKDGEKIKIVSLNMYREIYLA